MLRLRFSSGLIVGLVLGLAAGVLIANMLAAPHESAEPSAATMAQIQELTRRLELAKEERERADRQLERFQKLAEQMTTTFTTLEARFRALEDAERQRQVPAAADGPKAAQPDAAPVEGHPDPAAAPPPPAPEGPR